MINKNEFYGKVKVGVIAGLVGGFALFSSFFWIDSDVGVQSGTFYKMVGIAVGFEGITAIIFGFFAHMLTAATIGAVFCVCSTLHKLLNISSIPKGIFAGGVTGLEVYAIFFLPITLLVMLPIASDYSLQDNEDSIAISTLLKDANKILWGALILHVLFGAIMGLFSGMILYEDYHIKTGTSKGTETEDQSWLAT